MYRDMKVFQAKQAQGGRFDSVMSFLFMLDDAAAKTPIKLTEDHALEVRNWFCNFVEDNYMEIVERYNYDSISIYNVCDRCLDKGYGEVTLMLFGKDNEELELSCFHDSPIRLRFKLSD